MITIEEISKDEFPKVDFKFINHGNISALLWKIGILIESIKLDLTPSLKFKLSVNSKNIVLDAYNAGWGPASNIRLSIAEETITKFFTSSHSSSKLNPGENLPVAVLNIDFIRKGGIAYITSMTQKRNDLLRSLPNRMNNGDQSILEDKEISTLLCDHERWHLIEFFENIAGGASLSAPRQKWHIEYISKCRNDSIPINETNLAIAFNDFCNQSYEISNYRVYPSPYGQLWLNKFGFEFESYAPPLFCRAPISTTFIALIKQNNGCVEQTYRSSIIIQPGEVERFNIIVGADASCFVRAKFVFYFDNGNTIYSNLFDLYISHPKDKHTHAEDGSHFIQENNRWELDGRQQPEIIAYKSRRLLSKVFSLFKKR